MNNVTADIKDYKNRIAQGKHVEQKIIDSLRKNGLKVEDPTPHEDMTDKIDGWIVEDDGSRHSVQIKYRETGDDICFEILKDFDKDIRGRDLDCKAEFYLVVNRQGTGNIYATAPIKELAMKMLDAARKTLSVNPYQTNWKMRHWEMKITVDRAHNQRKLMAYMKPEIFTSLGQWENMI